MKRRMLIGILIIFMAGTLFAQKGIYIEQKVKTSGVMGQPGRESISKTWISDEKLRTDNGEQIVIIRTDKGVAWTIMPEKKAYMEMTLAELEAMASMGMAMMGEEASMKMTFRKTDETKKINDWNCYQVIGESKIMNQEMWVTEDLPFNKDHFYKFYKDMPEMRKVSEAFYKSEDIKGYPVYTETEMTMMGMKMNTSSELLEIRKESISPDKFELPDGYKKAENPMHNMPRPGNQ